MLFRSLVCRCALIHGAARANSATMNPSARSAHIPRRRSRREPSRRAVDEGDPEKRALASTRGAAHSASASAPFPRAPVRHFRERQCAISASASAPFPRAPVRHFRERRRAISASASAPFPRAPVRHFRERQRAVTVSAQREPSPRSSEPFQRARSASRTYSGNTLLRTRNAFNPMIFATSFSSNPKSRSADVTSACCEASSPVTTDPSKSEPIATWSTPTRSAV